MKTKWKYLRDYYKKECRKLNHPRSGAGAEDAPKESSWHYFSMMNFIKDVLFSEKTTNLEETPEPGGSQDEMMYLNEIEEDNMPSPNAHSEESVPLSNASTSSLRGKKKKKSQDDEFFNLEKRKLDLLLKESEREDDDDLNFFRSLLPEMKALPPWRKRRLKLKIHELVIKEAEGNEGQQSLPYEVSFVVPSQTSNEGTY